MVFILVKLRFLVRIRTSDCPGSSLYRFARLVQCRNVKLFMQPFPHTIHLCLIHLGLQTVQGVLEGTLQVLPDYVLDAPPPIPESPGDSLVCRLSDLPKTPSFLERSSSSVSLSGSQLLQEIGCR